MTINVLDELAALVKEERQALLSRWREQCGTCLLRGSLTFRPSMITFRDFLTNWPRPSN